MIIKIQDLYTYLIRKWWLFLIVGFLAGSAGFLYAYIQKPLYKSRLTFALDDGGGSASDFSSLISQFGMGTGGGNDVFAGDNILQILISRRMIERVLLTVDTFNNKPYTLAEYYIEKSSGSKDKNSPLKVYFPVGLGREKFNYLQDSLLKKIYADFSSAKIKAYRPDRKLNIYEVNITTPDERLTKIFTDRLVSETNSFYTEIRSKKAKETLEILETRVASMKGNLNSSIDNRAAVQDANVNPAFAASQIPIQKQQTNIQVYSGAYAEMFKNLEIARFQYLKEIPLLQIIDSANYPMEKIKLGKLKTAIIFSFISCIVLLFFLWFMRIMKLSRNDVISETNV